MDISKTQPTKQRMSADGRSKGLRKLEARSRRIPSIGAQELGRLNLVKGKFRDYQ